MPTLADALRDPSLLALPTAGALSLNSLRLEPRPHSTERNDVVATFALRGRESLVESRWNAREHTPGFSLPLDDGAHARVATALERFAGGKSPTALARALEADGAELVLAALMPPLPEGSLVAWFAARALEVLNGGAGDDATIASVDTPGGGRVTVRAVQAEVSPRFDDFGAVKITLRAAAHDAAGGLADVVEAECYSGSFEPGDVLVPAPTGGAERPAVEAWRSAFAARLAAFPLEPGRAPHPGVDLQFVPLAPLLALWLQHGPPGPRPERVRWDAAGVARGAAAMRALSEQELIDLRGDDAFVSAGYALGDWRVLLTTAGKTDEAFWEERLVLIGPDGERVLVLRGDAWNPATRFVVDADAALFRGVATWLREVVLAAKLDREMAVSVSDDEWGDDEDDEDEGEEHDGPESVAVSAWLRFYDADRERDGVPLIDWRIQGDMVADATYLDGGPYGVGPKASEQIRRVGIPLYYRFVREWIDPTFAPPT